MAQSKKKARGRMETSWPGVQGVGARFWSEEKCRRCPALCCRYIALELDTPKAPEDFDNIRWYLDHRKVSVFVQSGKWHLCIDTPCKNLVHNRCRIHGTKPQLCQRHDPSECEFDNPEFILDHEFRDWKDVEAWLEKRKKTLAYTP